MTGRPDWTAMTAADFDATAAPTVLFDLAPENVPTPDALF